MREGGRRVPMAAFVDRLHDLAKRHPALELKVTTVQRDWLAVLSSVGLDPEIFRYQVRMNGDEGAAEEFLRFQSSDTFVDFLLRVVTDADSVAQVAGNLAQVSGRLAKRPELELERNFLAGATQRPPAAATAAI